MIRLVCCVALLVGLTQAANGSIVISLDKEFSGATAPSGPAPWITLEFTAVNSDTVSLAVDGTNLAGPGDVDQFSVFMSGLYLNLDPLLNPTLLSIVQTSGPVASSFQTGIDAFKADGDGFFDIKIVWPDSGVEKFKDNSLATFEFSLIGGLSPDNFLFSSVEGGGAGSYLAAAHVQGIGASGSFSGWIGNGEGIGQPIPEPASLAVWTVLLVGCLAVRRRKLILFS